MIIQNKPEPAVSGSGGYGGEQNAFSGQWSETEC